MSSLGSIATTNFIPEKNVVDKLHIITIHILVLFYNVS